MVPGLPFSDTVDTTGATTDADDAQVAASNPDCVIGATNSVWYEMKKSTLIVPTRKPTT